MDVQEVEWIEFFAGLGNLTVMMKACQYPSLRFDVIDHQQSTNRGSNFMDLSHASGFAFLGIVDFFGFKKTYLLQCGCKLPNHTFTPTTFYA